MNILNAYIITTTNKKMIAKVKTIDALTSSNYYAAIISLRTFSTPVSLILVKRVHSSFMSQLRVHAHLYYFTAW